VHREIVIYIHWWYGWMLDMAQPSIWIVNALSGAAQWLNACTARGHHDFSLKSFVCWIYLVFFLLLFCWQKELKMIFCLRFWTDYCELPAFCKFLFMQILHEHRLKSYFSDSAQKSESF
jgi:hypothetical protein